MTYLYNINVFQKLKNYLWHLPKAIIASAIYGFPAKKLVVIGVTGTKGKTTTAHLIYHILKQTGNSVGLVSTIGAYFGDRQIDTGLHVTSPDPRELQKLLRQAVNAGIKFLVLEVTSSGLDQFRVWGIHFKVSMITNIYPDHLDYHGTMEKYVVAKAKIIRQSETVVLPKDLPYFNELNEIARGQRSEFRIKIVSFEGKETIISANKAVALKAAEVLGVKGGEAEKALASFPGVPGRFETIYDNKFKIIIDFAHTPESLTAALKELRSKVDRGGHLIAVFGCAGERDHGRRRMGAVAAKSADFFVITAEDPRSESVEEISEEIARYAQDAGAIEVSRNQLAHQRINSLTRQPIFIRIPDRQEAINFAISIAKPGDVVGLFGKGHEQSMCYGREEKPWSEHQAVKRAL